MRRLACLLAVALLALPSPSSAQQGVLFGSTTCGQVFQCPTSRDSETNRYVVSKIVQASNSCVASSFGMNKEGGYFEENMGLDFRNCLRSKPQQKKPGTRVMTPKCCAKPVKSGAQECQIVCELYIAQ